MKKLMLFIFIAGFSISALAQTAAPVASSSEDSNYLEIMNDPKSSFTEKSFAVLFKDSAAIKLEGQVEEHENFESFKVDFSNLVSNMFSMFSFASDDEDEEPTNIETILGYKCKIEGKCELKVLLKSGVKKKYDFEVLVSSQKPYAVKDNKVKVSVIP